MTRLARAPDEEHDADDGSLTLRAPRWLVAGVVALLAHAATVYLVSLLPPPPTPPQRIELTMQSRPPPPRTAAAPATPKARRTTPRPTAPPMKRAEPTPAPPSTSPILPELPPQDDPPDNRAELPVVEQSPEPAPPPAPSTWKERLLAQLQATRPRPPAAPTGPLAPSFANLERVALLDARLHDEETEQRLQEDFGPFFRRGIEALRGNWHPDEVLNNTERDPTRRCGRQTRTTFAVAVIDKQGDVVDVELKNPSGCPELDAEAIEAFKRVAQFPNPPDGLFVAPDGSPTATARYPVRFIVTFDGSLRLDWR